MVFHAREGKEEARDYLGGVDVEPKLGRDGAGVGLRVRDGG